MRVQRKHAKSVAMSFPNKSKSSFRWLGSISQDQNSLRWQFFSCYNEPVSFAVYLRDSPWYRYPQMKFLYFLSRTGMVAVEITSRFLLYKLFLCSFIFILCFASKDEIIWATGDAIYKDNEKIVRCIIVLTLTRQ